MREPEQVSGSLEKGSVRRERRTKGSAITSFGPSRAPILMSYMLLAHPAHLSPSIQVQTTSLPFSPSGFACILAIHPFASLRARSCASSHLASPGKLVRLRIATATSGGCPTAGMMSPKVAAEISV